MRVLLGLILALCVGSANAHVSAVPFPEVGSLGDAHRAAFSIVQTYLPPVLPQIACNIVTGTASVAGPCVSPAATCNGDVQTVTRTVTTTFGSKVLTTSASTFTAVVDVGKVIIVPGWDNAGTGGYNVISTVDSPTQVTLVNNVLTNNAGVSKAITFGKSDSAAFAAFNTWAVANQGSNQVVLTVPAGSNCWFGTNVSGKWAAGVKNLIVEGTGATLNSINGSAFQLGGTGMCFQGLATGCSARIKSVLAGASQIELTADSYAAGYISRFSVGGVVMVGGLDPQALFSPTTGFGDPTNLTYFEWKKITAICNNSGPCAGTATITLDSPLTDALSDQWPQYNAGDVGHSDGAGPATVWAMASSWDITAEYRGMTISQDGQTYAQGRNITYRNVTLTGSNAAIPTQNETWSAINSDFGFANLETDKLVGTMLLDGVTIAKIVNQSTSTKRLIIKNTTFSLGLDGGAQYTEISDSSLGTWGPGIFAYGTTGTGNVTSCLRCTISVMKFNFNSGYDDGGSGAFSKSGGVIKFSNAAAQGAGPAQRYFTPGGTVYLKTYNTNPPITFSCCESIGSFTVGTITADPWPSITDNQTLTTTVNIGSGTKTLNVPSAPFVSGDVGKTIIVNGAANGGGNLYTWVTAFSSATDVTLFNAAGTTVAGSQTIQWGTSNTYVQTSQSGGFPNTSAFSSTNTIGVMVSSSSNFTCDTCNAGSPSSDAYGVSLQAGATAAKPLGSYLSKPYTPTSAQGNLASLSNRGIFKSLRINVTAAATAAGSVTLAPGGQFHWYMVDQNTPSAPTSFDWVPANLSINLKQTGDRVITPSGVTCNGVAGGCSGDSINPPANLATMWLPLGGMLPYMGSTHTGAPTFTITMQTDPIQ